MFTRTTRGSGSADAGRTVCTTARRSLRAHTDVMNTLTRWVLRSVALWAVAKGLEAANRTLKRRQSDRRLRAQASNAASLPRTLSR